jgi:hypothetical protein
MNDGAYDKISCNQNSLKTNDFVENKKGYTFVKNKITYNFVKKEYDKIPHPER